jgi:hypothetical protein
MPFGSYALLVRRNAAGSSTPIHGLIYSRVFVDMLDRSDYTRAHAPSLNAHVCDRGWCHRCSTRRKDTPMKPACIILFVAFPVMTDLAIPARFLARPQLLIRV